ncbi:hypothetical protein MBLNU230_g6783t1 [Neophaeotheca triangularis]
MSYQYHDQNAAYGRGYPEPPRQQRPMRPPQGRRPPPPPGYTQHQQHPQQRRPPPMRPQNSNMRPSPQPVQQSPREHQYSAQSEESLSNLYDGSAYAESGFDMSDHWPLPAQQAARSPVPPQIPKAPSPRGPPPRRPQRPDALPRAIQGNPTQSQAPRAAAPNRRFPPKFPPDRPPQQWSQHGTGQWTGDGYVSPTTSLPSPNKSRPVTGSSTYSSDSANSYPSIPDFPSPQVPQQAAVYGRANQRPPLGPPPSARRGPSSCYGQPGGVHPITEEEESIRNSNSAPSLGKLNAGNHDSLGGKSYASSNAIPIGIPDYYLQSERGSAPSLNRSDGAHPESPLEPVPPLPAYMSQEQFPTPPPEPRDQASPEPASLVRQASWGKMRKPSLTTVKSGDKTRKNSASTQEGLPRKDSNTVGAGVASLPGHQRGRVQSEYQESLQDYDSEGRPETRDTTTGAAQEHDFRGLDKAVEAGYPPSISSSLDPPSDSEPERHGKKDKAFKGLLGAGLAKEFGSRSRSQSPTSSLSPQDKQIEDILKSLEKGGAITSDEAAKLQQHPDFAPKAGGRRRPPRLNLDETREAEARGSLTSLPDLIRRATRLASNLDRGRTASRLGMAAWLDGGSDSENEKNRARYEAALAGNRRSGSISDILGQFQAPPLGTPVNRSRTDIRGSLAGWSSRLRHNELASDSDAGEAHKARNQRTKNGRKRCCGMPLSLFLLIICLLIVLIAAAIILPIALIVIPNENSSNSSNPNCSPQLSCSNGGLNLAADDGSCRCLCVAGYTGNECNAPSTAACTSMEIAGTTDDATVGNDIPALVQNAESDYGIPLNSERILSLFSANNLSCASENALVSFSFSTTDDNNDDNTLSSRKTKRSHLLSHLLRLRSPTPTSDAAPAAAAATSNGILFDSSPAPETSSSPDDNDPFSSPSSSNSTATTPQLLNLARTAVLFVFQASGEVDAAAGAQEELQAWFRRRGGGGGSGGDQPGAEEGRVSLGGGFVVDLDEGSLRSRNGTIVGGGGGG